MKKNHNTTHDNDYYEYFDVAESSDVTFSDCDDDYSDVFDEDGDSVICDCCGDLIKFRNGKYVCSGCGQVLSRSEFFNYIGADIPGDECLTCDNLYPGCTQCPYGYEIED